MVSDLQDEFFTHKFYVTICVILQEKSLFELYSYLFHLTFTSKDLGK